MIKILSDSTCDLSEDLVSRYNLGIVPLRIVLDDKDFRDRTEITPDEIYAWSDANKTTPKTAACSLEDVAYAYKQALAEADEVIVFTISVSMSTTNNIFRIVAEEMGISDKVSVVDSANLSTGIGLLVCEAAEMVQAGKSRGEIVAEMEELKPLVRASFVTDTLTYLYRGGRCSAVAALAGGVLKLHPKIMVENGAMRPDKKYRGKIDKVIVEYAEDSKAELLKARKERVFITHSGCSEETIDLVRNFLNELNYFDEILVTRAGGVISSHCGWGTLGVLFIAGE